MSLVLLGICKMTSWNGKKSYCQQLEHILVSVTIFSQTMQMFVHDVLIMCSFVVQWFWLAILVTLLEQGRYFTLL